ncbi:Alpha/Beta hydrolase protein [Mariannaea sp. PMI_226]|nr:Alpha/Beta hydrolase protein [Mariannaea sp. PMI_226]
MEASEELFVTLPTRVRLCYQTYGSPADPAIVLINGHSSSMVAWGDELLELLRPAGVPRYMIRFDHRDTGLSTEFPVPAGYSISDMAGDVEGLIDHLGLASKGFHILGASMGGPIACMVAGRRLGQVRSLTLLYTTPGATAGLPLGEGPQGLMAGMPYDRKSHIEFGIALQHALLTQPASEQESKRIEEHVVRITDRDMRGGTLYSKGPNHGAAAFGGWPGMETLKKIKCPATVIQAGKDQFFGVAHGETLAREIQGAEYVLWEDVGHELPRRVWNRVAETALRTWQRGDDEWEKRSITEE